MAAAEGPPRDAVPPTPGSERWSSHRIQSVLVRVVSYLTPLGGSILFVHLVSKVVPAPRSSLWLFLSWWLLLSVAATGVLLVVDRYTRRLLPLATLLKLSLVFPDQAPSRFKVALRSGSVDRLEERVADAARRAKSATPGESAARLLELVAMLNIHDRLTRGHCERVRAYSVLIGQELGLTRDELDLLNWAALLHDVGKLDVPSEILLKPGKPTDEEWDVLRKHPLFGELLVEPLREWLGRWTAAIGYHHERWDGHGYPRGLAGEEIPLPGRIVAVADVFDVITSARSYKEASAVAAARAEIARCAGTQFDPHVVRAFLNVSLGRMRLVMGPLSLLAHAPLLARLPLTPAMGTLAGAFTVAATSAAGVVAGPTAPAAALPPPLPAHVRHVARPSSPRLHPFVPRAPRRPATPVPPPAAPAEPAPVAQAPSRPPPTAPAAAPPLAAADAARTYAGEPVTIDVLANDVGGPLRLLSLDPPQHGEASILGDAVVYRAPRAYAGPDSFVYHVVRADGALAAGTVTVDVLHVNQAPTFQPGSPVSVPEDAATVEQPWATAIGPGTGDPPQRVHFEVTTPDPGLFRIQPSLSPGGVLTFAPAADAFGTTTARVVAVDDGGTAHGGIDTSPPSTFAIEIRPVNDPPSFVPGGDVAVGENSGPQSFAWATNISPGPANESWQTVRFTTETDSPQLFAPGGLPSVAAGGVLTFTPAFLAAGTATVTVVAHDDGGTVDGGVDTATRTFRLTIEARNQPPLVVGIGNIQIDEDAPPQALQWTTELTPGAPNETSQTLTLTTSNTDPGLFSMQPSFSPSGFLTYTAAPDAFGTATVTLTAKDDGGTASGGQDTSTTSFTITVEPVNDAPSFTKGADESTYTNAGAQTVAGWATSISPGPPNESAQQVTFAVTNDAPALFATQPAVAADGTLTYTPAANANGTATVTVTAHDNGGTANGGTDQSPPQTFTITVQPVNQPPTFTAGPDQATDEDSGPQTVTAWATQISPGPADEASQTVTFTTGNDNNALFATQPAVAADGTLTYTPAANTAGTATVTVTAHDNGGTADGGTDQSPPQTFTITVEAPPAAVADSFQSTVDTEIAGNVLANDSDPQGSPLTVQTSPAPTASNGTVTMDASGNFVYTPAAGFTGSDSFSYTVTNGLGLSATATVSITIVAPVVPTTLVSSVHGTTSGPLSSLTSTVFTPVSGATYLVFVGHISSPLDTALLTVSGNLQVANLGLPVTSAVSADGSTYGWAWEVHGTGTGGSSISVSFTQPNSQPTQSDVMQVVQVAGSSPWYVGSGTATAGSVTSSSASVTLASPSAGDSEAAFLYVNGDTAGDPGWATPGIATMSGSVMHQPDGTKGFGTLVAYAPQALASATTRAKLPAKNGNPYISLAFELLP